MLNDDEAVLRVLEGSDQKPADKTEEEGVALHLRSIKNTQRIRRSKRRSHLELRVGAHWSGNAVSFWQAETYPPPFGAMAGGVRHPPIFPAGCGNNVPCV